MNAHLVSDYCDVSISVLSVGLIKCLAWYVHNDKVIAPELDKTDMVQETAACQVWTFFSSALWHCWYWHYRWAPVYGIVFSSFFLFITFILYVLFVRFLQCDAMRCTVSVIVILSVRLSVRPSVRPSVTLVHCVHRPTIMVSSPYGSPIILVSGDITVIPKFEGGHPERGRWMRVGWVRIGDFRPISRRISETVRDTTKVTIYH